MTITSASNGPVDDISSSTSWCISARVASSSAGSAVPLGIGCRTGGSATTASLFLLPFSNTTSLAEFQLVLVLVLVLVVVTGLYPRTRTRRQKDEGPRKATPK